MVTGPGESTLTGTSVYDCILVINRDSYDGEVASLKQICVLLICRLLICEDGYCDYPKPRDPGESISDDIYFDRENAITSLNCERDGFSQSNEYLMQQAVANMSYLQYGFGEGYSSSLD